MEKRKKRPKMIFKKFLKDNQQILVELDKGSSKVEKYTRESWMMRSNPPVDEAEEVLRKEADSF